MLRMMSRANPEGGDLAKKLKTYDIKIPLSLYRQMTRINAPKSCEKSKVCNIMIIANDMILDLKAVIYQRWAIS